jgi:hypothetical protein
MMIRIVDVDETNVDDVIFVCSGKHLDDPVLKEGMKYKREWVKETHSKYGPFTKIAYYNDEPAAQILFYPEEALPYYNTARKRVIEIFCVYRALDEAKGAGSALLNNLIDESRKGIRCLRGEKCRFLVSKPFNTGEGVSLEKFYTDNGFLKAGDEMYLELNDRYESREHEVYDSPEKDNGKAIIFYDMNCEYGWFHAVNVKKILLEMDDTFDIQLMNKWLNPKESMRRGNNTIIVNGKAILSYWQTPEFKEEVLLALRS